MSLSKPQHRRYCLLDCLLDTSSLIWLNPWSTNQLYIKHVIVLTIACEYTIQVLTIIINHNIWINVPIYYSPDSLQIACANTICSAVWMSWPLDLYTNVFKTTVVTWLNYLLFNTWLQLANQLYYHICSCDQQWNQLYLMIISYPFVIRLKASYMLATFHAMA